MKTGSRKIQSEENMNNSIILLGVLLLGVLLWGGLFLAVNYDNTKTKTKIQNYESALNIYIKCREKSADKSICARPKVQDYFVVN